MNHSADGGGLRPEQFQDELLRLASALEQLPEPQRSAVEHHHLHGFTLAQTAEQLGRSAAAVAGQQILDFLSSGSLTANAAGSN